MPDVCFVIPCFNHGRFVREAVDSSLSQEGGDVGVVVVDDGSTDGTTPAACDACRSDRVAVIHQDNQGLPAARNRGAAEAARLWAPRYLVFLDADDFVRPTFIRTLRAALEDETAAGSDDASHAYCQEELIELGTGTWRVPEWDPLLLTVTNLHPVTALVRRDRFEAVGGFDETMRDGYEDWDFWLKLAEHGWRGVRVRQPLFVWRRHSASTMVMEAVKRHDDLYGQIMARHRRLYDRRAAEIIALSNTMLRKFDANWIDETGFPIPLQHLRRCADELMLVRHEMAGLQKQLEDQRAWYESFAAVRLHRSLHRAVNAMPRPLSVLFKRLMNGARRIVPGPARAGTPGPPPAART